MSHSRNLILALGLVCLLFSMGCGNSSLMPLQGRVTQDGQPVTAQLPNVLQVKFHKMKEGRRVNVFPARVNQADGTFDVIGPEKYGVPFGNYKVSVELVDKHSADHYKKAYHFDNTPFEFEITPDSTEIVLEVKAPAG